MVPRSMVFALVLLAWGVSAQQRSTPEAFYEAIRGNDLAALRALTGQHGSTTADAQGQTPLMFAAAFGTADAMRVLIEAGAPVDAVSNAGVSALHWAAGDAGKARLLVERGAAVDVVSKAGRTPLLVAASTNGATAVVRLLLDRGAKIDHADPAGVTALLAAASVDDLPTARLLLERGADPNARAAGVPQAATPLMGAAYNGNLELVRLLLRRRPDVQATSAPRGVAVKNGFVQFGNATALHMAMVGGNAEIVRLLLDAGARIDALDARGMSPLVWAVATDRAQPAIVRLLVGRGANRTIRTTGEETVTDWARKFNHPQVLAAIGLVGSARADGGMGGSPLAEPPRPDAVRLAVTRSMPLLRAAADNMLPRGGCVACHAQPITALAAQLAARRGWDAPENRADVDASLATMGANAPVLMQGREPGGFPDLQLYMTVMLAAKEILPSFATDAFVHFLAAKQRPDGSWRGIGPTRAPIQDGNFSRTAMAIRTLKAYGIPARQAEFDERVARAAGWLATEVPLTTEDRVMQLLGLRWAGSHAAARARLSQALAAAQRPDGGWGQTPQLPSDAYATGQAMFTLREMGLSGDAPALLRGAAFLLRTQQEDGTWYVKSRAMKIQPYFESGFPYGHDQWISQAATAWATMGLASGAE